MTAAVRPPAFWAACGRGTAWCPLPKNRHTGIRNRPSYSKRVGEGGRAVRAHHLDALQKPFGRAAIDHLLDDQRADHAGRCRLFIFREFRFFVARFDERQDGDRLGVRFVDVGIERRFDLRGHVRGVAREPDVLARLHHGGRELAEHHGDVRAFVERVLPADGFDRAAAAAADGDAHAVAADQPAAFVGDRVGGLADVEFFVGRARERFELFPQRSAFRRDGAAGRPSRSRRRIRTPATGSAGSRAAW